MAVAICKSRTARGKDGRREGWERRGRGWEENGRGGEEGRRMGEEGRQDGREKKDGRGGEEDGRLLNGAYTHTNFVAEETDSQDYCPVVSPEAQAEGNITLECVAHTHVQYIMSQLFNHFTFLLCALLRGTAPWC